jgi:hypothetical protein
MKHVQQVTAIIEREGAGYVALCPELDVASQGDSIESARKNLRHRPAPVRKDSLPHFLPPSLHRLLHQRHELVGDGAVYQAVVVTKR